jgi:hypothetical protein
MMRSVPCPTRPELLALLERSVERVKNMSLEERAEMHRAQRRSWAIGELMLEHPMMQRDEAAEIVDAVIARGL